MNQETMRQLLSVDLTRKTWVIVAKRAADDDALVEVGGKQAHLWSDVLPAMLADLAEVGPRQVSRRLRQQGLVPVLVVARQWAQAGAGEVELHIGDVGETFPLTKEDAAEALEALEGRRPELLPG